MEDQKKIVYSAIQPSGMFIGNYFGAMKNWVPVQNDAGCLFCLADLHAITVPGARGSASPDLRMYGTAYGHRHRS